MHTGLGLVGPTRSELQVSSLHSNPPKASCQFSWTPEIMEWRSQSLTFHKFSIYIYISQFKFKHFSNFDPKSLHCSSKTPAFFLNPNPISITDQNPKSCTTTRNQNPRFSHPCRTRSNSIPSSSFLAQILTFVTKSPNLSSNILNRCCISVRAFSIPSFSSIPPKPPNLPSKSNRNSRLLKISKADELAPVLELIERGDFDIELNLNQMLTSLSIDLVGSIVSSLSDRGISCLRFFDWFRNKRPDFHANCAIYNLIIDNFGQVGDYESMLVLLSELSPRRHCLTEKAFGFLTVLSSDRERIRSSVERVVETLNRVRGSCYNSGIFLLIKTLCDTKNFDWAMYVMKETARKTSYYNALIAAKCRDGSFEEALELLDEMRRFGCDPNTKSYNYLLGSLCKRGRTAEACELIEVMENFGYLPDSVTFEIVVIHACRLGNMDFAIEFLYYMLAGGIKPRVGTHAAFIRGYFHSGLVGDAHKYVVDMSSKDKCSANMNYSLLASLFHKSGMVIESRNILVEMMEKGLKPNFSVYIKVLKGLFKLGMGDVVADLKSRYSKFHPKHRLNG